MMNSKKNVLQELALYVRQALYPSCFCVRHRKVPFFLGGLGQELQYFEGREVEVVTGTEGVVDMVVDAESGSIVFDTMEVPENTVVDVETLEKL